MMLRSYLNQHPAKLAAATLLILSAGCAAPKGFGPWGGGAPASGFSPAVPNASLTPGPNQAGMGPAGMGQQPIGQPSIPQGAMSRPPTASAPGIQQVAYTTAAANAAAGGYPVNAQMAGFRSRQQQMYGTTCPPQGCPPSGHGAGPCTAGCCGPQPPQYPCMPPLSQFGLDPQEFLCDGGDQSPRAMYTQNESIVGVNLEDTVVKYETAKGEIHVTPSNRVCVYAPRFAAVRRINGAVTDDQALGPATTDLADGPVNVLAEQPSSAVMAPLGPEKSAIAEGPDGMRTRAAGVPIDRVQAPLQAEDVLAALVNLSVINTGILREADKPWLAKGAAAAEVWADGLAPEVAVEHVKVAVASRDVAAEGLTTYDLPGGRLRVIKVADRDSAQVGDIVTFVLRVDNIGEGPIDGVVLTDNLTTRMEYVEDSQTCTKGATFEATPNDGGSLRLTWTFTDDFEVGEGAIVRFRCRVR